MLYRQFRFIRQMPVPPGNSTLRLRGSKVSRKVDLVAVDHENHLLIFCQRLSLSLGLAGGAPGVVSGAAGAWILA